MLEILCHVTILYNSAFFGFTNKEKANQKNLKRIIFTRIRYFELGDAE